MDALDSAESLSLTPSSLSALVLPPRSTLRINFPTVASALIVYNSVVVDEEIRPKAIYRHLRVDGNAIEW